MSDSETAVDTLSFEDALKELEAIVGRLEQGQGSLDDAIEAYARGATLKEHCQKKLDEARMRVEKIRLSSSGAPAGTEPLDN